MVLSHCRTFFTELWWLANICGHSCFPCETFYVCWTLLDKMSGEVWALCRTSAEVCRHVRHILWSLNDQNTCKCSSYRDVILQFDYFRLKDHGSPSWWHQLDYDIFGKKYMTTWLHPSLENCLFYFHHVAPLKVLIWASLSMILYMCILSTDAEGDCLIRSGIDLVSTASEKITFYEKEVENSPGITLDRHV